MEAVQIFHQELAAAHDAGFGAFFVAEFSLELVDCKWEVFVARNVIFHHVGDRLFVSRGKTNHAAARNFGFEPDVDFLVRPATGLFPKLGILKSGELHFFTADAVELVANDIFDVVDDTHAEWQVVIDAGHFFVDEAGTS